MRDQEKPVDGYSNVGVVINDVGHETDHALTFSTPLKLQPTP